MGDMKIGDIGIIIEQTSDYKDEIILRCHCAVVSLSHPMHVWKNMESGRGFKVKLFPVGTKIILEVQ